MDPPTDNIDQLSTDFSHNLKIRSDGKSSKFFDVNGNFLLDDLLAYNRSCRRPCVEGTLIQLDNLRTNYLGWTDVTLPNKGFLIGSSKFQRRYSAESAKWINFDINKFKGTFDKLFLSKTSQKSIFEECPGVILAGGFLVNYLTGTHSSMSIGIEPKTFSSLDDSDQELDNELDKEREVSLINKYPDIDLFLVQPNQDEEKLCQLVDQTIDWIKQNHGIKGTPFVTKNAITILDKLDQEWQIILRRYSTMDEILWGFDLACCQLLYDGNHLYTTQPGLISFKYNITLVEPETWYYCFENRLEKYASKRGFFFYLWFISDPWPVNSPSNVGLLIDKTSKKTKFYGRGGSEMTLPYLSLSQMIPVILIKSGELELISIYEEMHREMEQINFEIHDLRKRIQFPKGNKDVHQVIIRGKLQQKNRKSPEFYKGELNRFLVRREILSSVLANFKLAEWGIRLKYTRVALVDFKTRNCIRSNPILYLLTGRISKNRFEVGASDYQPGKIVYENDPHTTWVNLRAIYFMFLGKTSYPVGQLNGKLTKEIQIFLDHDYIRDYLQKWSDLAKKTVITSITAYNLKLLLGDDQIKVFMEALMDGDIWSFEQLYQKHLDYLASVSHLLKFPIQIQTINTGTVISVKNDPGRGKSIKEWAGGWASE